MAKLGPDTLQRRLMRALDVAGKTHTPQDVADLVQQGRLQSWVSGDSMVLTEVIEYPRGNALNVFLAVGNMHEVLGLIPKMEAFGREHGCKVMRMEGRKGWRRVLPSYGWKEDRKVIMERML